MNTTNAAVVGWVFLVVLLVGHVVVTVMIRRRRRRWERDLHGGPR